MVFNFYAELLMLRIKKLRASPQLRFYGTARLNN